MMQPIKSILFSGFSEDELDFIERNRSAFIRLFKQLAQFKNCKAEVSLHQRDIDRVLITYDAGN